MYIWLSQVNLLFLDLRIPAFEIPLDNSLTVTLKEFSSVKDFWIQKVEDDFDILMEKMW